MDQELKQRLIGAAVITALAAVFVPMLFDDPVDEIGKNINTLKIPELPAKAQEVEIMPLPEKVEDVATEEQSEKLPNAPDEGTAELPHPKLRLSAQDTPIVSKRQQFVEPDEQDTAGHVNADAEAEDVVPATKPLKSAATLLPPQTGTSPIQKLPKPVMKASDAAQGEIVAKPSTAASTGVAADHGTRWYLNAGSFSQKANALALQENLKRQGFMASVKEVAGEKGTIFKVRVGPMTDKAKAQVVKNKLMQININSFVSPDE